MTSARKTKIPPETSLRNKNLKSLSLSGRNTIYLGSVKEYTMGIKGVQGYTVIQGYSRVYKGIQG